MDAADDDRLILRGRFTKAEPPVLQGFLVLLSLNPPAHIPDLVRALNRAIDVMDQEPRAFVDALAPLGVVDPVAALRALVAWIESNIEADHHWRRHLQPREGEFNPVAGVYVSKAPALALGFTDQGGHEGFRVLQARVLRGMVALNVRHGQREITSLCPTGEHEAFSRMRGASVALRDLSWPQHRELVRILVEDGFEGIVGAVRQPARWDTGFLPPFIRRRVHALDALFRAEAGEPIGEGGGGGGGRRRMCGGYSELGNSACEDISEEDLQATLSYPVRTEETDDEDTLPVESPDGGCVLPGRAQSWKQARAIIPIIRRRNQLLPGDPRIPADEELAVIDAHLARHLPLQDERDVMIALTAMVGLPPAHVQGSGVSGPPVSHATRVTYCRDLRALRLPLSPPAYVDGVPPDLDVACRPIDRALLIDVVGPVIEPYCLERLKMGKAVGDIVPMFPRRKGSHQALSAHLHALAPHLRLTIGRISWWPLTRLARTHGSDSASLIVPDRLALSKTSRHYMALPSDKVVASYSAVVLQMFPKTFETLGSLR